MSELNDWLTPSPPEAAIEERESAQTLLRRAILRGELLNVQGRTPTEAEPLSEQHVVETYEDQGIRSRMPVRMALSVLALEGLIRQRARHGFWIAAVAPRVVQQVAQLRSATEAMIAESLHSALHHDPQISHGSSSDVTEPLSQMRQIAQNQALNSAPLAGVPLDVEADFADLDTEFHIRLASVADHELAGRHIAEWRNLMRLHRLQIGVRYNVAALFEICSEHDSLIAAISNLEPETPPGDLARDHIQRALARCAPTAVVVVPENTYIEAPVPVNA